MNIETLFWELYRASEADDVNKVLTCHQLIQSPSNWRPYGGNDNNFGVVENQQASPISALIEKITNGIDAILMRVCIEQGIDPRSNEAPRSIEEALQRFFPDHKNWDLPKARRNQAERLQILADGKKKEPSLVIYDDGEGQAPKDFEATFLSLLRGNKNDIHFVQGKYNMGGAGAVVFCGGQRYQLIGSKRFNNDNPFGFTLVRRHPFTPDEEKTKKATWYEYLVIDEQIPSFNCGDLDLGLYKRRFTTGTVIKLYSYELPVGSRSVISRDLNQSINEYLFDPALPVFTIDNPQRYPKDRNLERELYGLKRRLEEDSRYIEEFFSEEISDRDIGCIRVTCYVFKPRVDDKSVKETRETIQREFFKNKMSVLFSVNGQVHGHYRSEFITRALKFPLLKDHLLIHVDCTGIHTEFRNELFMASRDRLKGGKESQKLRDKLSNYLEKGRLKDIYKERKASISVESKDAEDLIRNLSKNLPIRHDLAELLSQTFKLDDHRNGQSREQRRETYRNNPKEKETFSPKRYPSIFSIDVKKRNGGNIPMVQIPMGGERTIKFSTDVEDRYFDRTEDPGKIQIGLLGLSSNGATGGTAPGEPKDLETILNVVKSSPRNGTIHVLVKPTEEVKVGDAIKLRASLSSPEKEFEQIFLVKIAEQDNKPKEHKKNDKPDTQLGLPQLVMVYKEPNPGDPDRVTWDKLADLGMTRDTVVVPFVEGESLDRVYINMDSKALLSYRSKLTGGEVIEVAEKRYVSAVYFHTLFLYTITKNRKFGIIKQHTDEQEEDELVEIKDYISDLFETFYAQFLLNFDTQELIAALEA